MVCGCAGRSDDGCAAARLNPSPSIHARRSGVAETTKMADDYHRTIRPRPTHFADAGVNDKRCPYNALQNRSSFSKILTKNGIEKTLCSGHYHRHRLGKLVRQLATRLVDGRTASPAHRCRLLLTGLWGGGARVKGGEEQESYYHYV
ncbi:hypothetical protein RR46_12719 [Papilio xuthus]|uniref:Uncharacterized protein n=1 Tax=Papilio xuthus TaxID=66420 RepID=A0A194PVA4_PAPXU|nr:hypothetical protein RR46_12719 [Papilio xuthus]